MEKEDMALQAQKGNQAALFQLWETVKTLVYSKAWKFYTSHGNEKCLAHGITLEDLKQESFIAFVDAVKAYNPEKGYLFTTYLNYATDNSFKACMGIKTKKDALNYADRLERQIAGEEDNFSLGDTIQDEKAAADLEMVDKRQEEQYFSDVLRVALAELPGIQGDILKQRFFHRQTVGQAAEVLGVDQNIVKNEGLKGLKNLRTNPQIQSLHDDMIETAAYRGTGWTAWYYDQGSIEERLLERKAAFEPSN